MGSAIEDSLKLKGTPVVCLSLFRFRGWQKAWAFYQMARGRFLLNDEPGLRFWKLMGTGTGIGFSMTPDLGQYGLLTVWDDVDHANTFLNKGQLASEFHNHSSDHSNFYLVPTKSQGLWSGENPFEPVWDPEHLDTANLRMAILTRATIAWSSLHRFWQHVPYTSQELENSKGVQFSAGLGEAPFVLQATFSIWQNYEAMKNFAYNSPEHLEVIRKTREEQWYAEELFARFYLLDDLKRMNAN
jgi:heme-degrading monooxygenase HmoA